MTAQGALMGGLQLGPSQPHKWPFQLYTFYFVWMFVFIAWHQLDNAQMAGSI